MRDWSRMIAFVVMLFVTPVWAQDRTAETEFTGAVITEQNVTFAVVIVKSATLDDKNFADGIIQTLGPSFGDIPVILMAQDAQGTPTYYGRPDIAEFLANTPVENIPWKKYALKPTESP